MRVAVVGAGVAGLATAHGLQRAGAEVTVFERDERVRSGGYGLSLFGNGIAALRSIGYDTAALVEPPAPVQAPGGIRDASGRWVLRTGDGVAASAHVVRRDDLHELLLSPVRGCVMTSADVVGLVSSDVVLADGRRIGPFDLVVAADGLNSTLRGGVAAQDGAWSPLGTRPGTSRATPSRPASRTARVQYSGYHAWRGMVADDLSLAGLGELWGHGRRFGIAPLVGGGIYWFATISAPARPEVPASLDLVRDTFAGWHDDVQQVLGATTVGSVGCLPINELHPGPPSFVAGRQWTHGSGRARLVLLGDAAHGMTPNLGQGANQGLEDAAQLAVLVAPVAADAVPDSDRLDAALVRYDSLRRPRVAAIARQSRVMGRAAHMNRRLAVSLRDRVLREIPTRLADRASLGVQQWEPEVG